MVRTGYISSLFDQMLESAVEKSTVFGFRCLSDGCNCLSRSFIPNLLFTDCPIKRKFFVKLVSNYSSDTEYPW